MPDMASCRNLLRFGPCAPILYVRGEVQYTPYRERGMVYVHTRTASLSWHSTPLFSTTQPGRAARPNSSLTFFFLLLACISCFLVTFVPFVLSSLPLFIILQPSLSSSSFHSSPFPFFVSLFIFFGGLQPDVHGTFSAHPFSQSCYSVTQRAHFFFSSPHHFPSMDTRLAHAQTSSPPPPSPLVCPEKIIIIKIIIIIDDLSRAEAAAHVRGWSETCSEKMSTSRIMETHHHRKGVPYACRPKKVGGTVLGASHRLVGVVGVFRFHPPAVALFFFFFFHSFFLFCSVLFFLCAREHGMAPCYIVLFFFVPCFPCRCK